MGNNPSTEPLPHAPKRRQSRRTSNFIGANKPKQSKFNTGSANITSGSENYNISSSIPIVNRKFPPDNQNNNYSFSKFNPNSGRKNSIASDTVSPKDFSTVHPTQGGLPATTEDNESPEMADIDQQSFGFNKHKYDIPQDEFIEHVESSTGTSSSILLRRSSNGSSFDVDNNNTIHDDIINKDDDEIEANVLVDYMSNDAEYRDITVPVAIKWKGAAREVYVVGSFTNWLNKIKLNQIGPQEFAIQLFLRIGFYRFQFIVDGEIKCSNNLPKATEANGNFVNWFEVVKNNTQYNNSNIIDSSAGASAGPIAAPIPKPAHLYSGKVTNNKNDDYFGPISEDMNTLRLQSERSYYVSNEALNEYRKMNPVLTPVPRKKVEYTSEIPSIYIDTEDYDETVMDSTTMLKKKGLPEPPSLPPYLNNVLLNKKEGTLSKNATINNNVNSSNSNSININGSSHGALHSPRYTPGSNPTNDANILSVPNHVILNHLITTSIKNNVLAVACINRYAGKFITQVTYSPIETLPEK